MRLAQGAGDGPALLFNNIKDYNKPDTRCRRVFGSGLSSYSAHRHDARPAEGHASASELVKLAAPSRRQRSRRASSTPAR